MAELNQHGIINLITSIICIIIMIVCILLGSGMRLEGALFTIVFGVGIPIIVIGAVWTENFGKHLLKYKNDFKKRYMEDKLED